MNARVGAVQETADTQKEADAAVGERDRLSALLVRRNEELAKATEKVCAAQRHLLIVVRSILIVVRPAKMPEQSCYLCGAIGVRCVVGGNLGRVVTHLLPLNGCHHAKLCNGFLPRLVCLLFKPLSGRARSCH
jgi:hypothetical protein